MTFVAIGFGAFALGKRFRMYSLATLRAVMVFGALAAPHGATLRVLGAVARGRFQRHCHGLGSPFARQRSRAEALGDR